MNQLSRSGSTERDRAGDIKNNDEQQQKEGKLTLITDYLIDYTVNCNLHGVKYVGEKKSTPVEKIFWIIMLTCSVMLSGIWISKIFVKWNESPVIVTFAEKSTPIWQIPYPAVTICSETKVLPELFNFTKYTRLYNNNITKTYLTDNEKEMFEHISMVCGHEISDAESKKFVIDNIIKVAPTNRVVFRTCAWNQNTHNCESLFSPILTEEGLCYTFNTLDAGDLLRIENLHSEYHYLENQNLTPSWTLDTGYFLLDQTSVDTYPRRSYGYGLKEGLNIDLGCLREHIDYFCSGPIQGFKILLHNPAELPDFSNHYIRLPPSKDLLVAIKPKMITTSEILRSYDPESRQCYFQHERYLLYFKVYTQNNCEMECLTNFTYVRCGCVHFGMPHGPNMNVCNAAGIGCITNARRELVMVDIQLGIETQRDNVTLVEAIAVASQCKCLPACTSIEYEAETSQADFDWKGYFKSLDNDFWDWFALDENYRASKAAIYFKEAQFIPSRRSELYGRTDFLANCGGLLGLFMGFSILSVAEIVYFMTLRFGRVLWRYFTRN